MLAKMQKTRRRCKMNSEWSQLNKTMQLQIKKKETFDSGIETLLTLRRSIMEQIVEFRNTLTIDDFSAMPYMNANGYHNKTVAYSLYHVFRIEDIVANTLISKSPQIFFIGSYKTRLNSPIITTGNELVKQEISDFSAKLDIDGLYNYISDVDKSTAHLLKTLTFSDMKTKMTEQDKDNIRSLKVVDEDESSVWLIDYWCSKNIQGLLQMPFSRHWIMHTEAALRIADKLTAK